MKQQKKLLPAAGIGTAAGTLIIILLMLVISLIITKTKSFNVEIITPAAVICGCVGSFAGGYISARIRRSSGMLSGIVSAAAILFLMLCAGVIAGSLPTVTMLLRAAAMLLSGALGGIIAVNCAR